MDEIQETKGEEQKSSSVDTSKGNKPTKTDLIDNANAAAERLKGENDRKEELLRQETELEARRALGGRSGMTVKPQKQEISNADYVKSVLAGKLPELE